MTLDPNGRACRISASLHAAWLAAGDQGKACSGRLAVPLRLNVQAPPFINDFAMLWVPRLFSGESKSKRPQGIFLAGVF